MNCPPDNPDLENPERKEELPAMIEIIPTPPVPATRELNTTDPNLPVSIVADKLWPKTGVTAEELTEICEQRGYNAVTAELLVEICRYHDTNLPMVLKLIDQAKITPAEAQVVCQAMGRMGFDEIDVVDMTTLVKIAELFPSLGLEDPETLQDAISEIQNATRQADVSAALSLFDTLIQGVHNHGFEDSISALRRMMPHVERSEAMDPDDDEDDDVYFHPSSSRRHEGDTDDE